MAQHRLYVPDIGATIEHQRCHRMPEEVAAPALAARPRCHVPGHQFRQAVKPDAAAPAGEEKRGAVATLEQGRPCIPEIPRDPAECPAPNRDNAVALAFAGSNQENPTPGIHVRDRELRHLCPTNASRIQHLEQGAISQSQHHPRNAFTLPRYSA